MQHRRFSFPGALPTWHRKLPTIEYNMNVNLLIVICHVSFFCRLTYTADKTLNKREEDGVVSYDGYQLWKVTTDTEEKLDLIKSLQSAFGKHSLL